MPNLQSLVRAAVVVAGLSTLAKGEAMFNSPDNTLVSRSEDICGAKGLPDIDNSDALPMDEDGSIHITMNTPVEAHHFTAKVDSSATGNHFQVAGVMPTNGPQANIQVSLPPGIRCIAGKQGNRCLLTLTNKKLNHTSCIIIEKNGGGLPEGFPVNPSLGSYFDNNTTGDSSSGESSPGGGENTSGGHSTEPSISSFSGGDSTGQSNSGGSSQNATPDGSSSGNTSATVANQSTSGGSGTNTTSAGIQSLVDNSGGNSTNTTSAGIQLLVDNSGGNSTNTTSTGNQLHVDNSGGRGSGIDKPSHLRKNKCRRPKNKRRSVTRAQ